MSAMSFTLALLMCCASALAAETCARHPSFPPPASPAATARWFREQLPELPGPPTALCGERCQAHARWSAVEYMAARKSGEVTCEEYAASLILRAKHYRDMNQFMNWDNDPHWTDRVLDAARALDVKASREGIEAIAPLYGLPIPMKGTMATVDFISSAGVSLLHDFRAKDDADFVKLVKAKHGVVYGKTNVPEFAASLVTCNPANGCTLNPHGRHLTSGGSSGGAASAVASLLAPVAVSEDTGGSTRSPAFSNGNFGYDPTRNHYPNAGNPGMALILDQLGLNARSMEDIIALDGVFCDYDPSTVKSKKISELRIGVPQYPYVEAYVPAGGDNPFNFSQYPMAYMPSRQIMKKYEAAKVALRASGAQVVEKEWPTEGGTNVLAKAFFLMKMGDEVVSPYWHVFHSFMGQVSQWINDYLGAPGITISDVVAAAQPAGIGHDPPKIMQANTSEEKLAFVIQELRQAGVAAWNRLFDEEELDLILIPGFLHTPTYECMASSTCEHQVKNLITGEVTTEAKFASLDNLFMHSTSMKHMPLPKMMVPVGLDHEGHPVGLQFMGRAGPPKSKGLGYSYDSKLLKVVDAPFLKAVQVAVDAMVKQDPSLARVEAQLVKGLENLFQ